MHNPRITLFPYSNIQENFTMPKVIAEDLYGSRDDTRNDMENVML
jgi:hypothetical protein